jgi:hypothetical protein
MQYRPKSSFLFLALILGIWSSRERGDTVSKPVEKLEQNTDYCVLGALRDRVETSLDWQPLPRS